jgi:hypothetical protein
MLVPENAKPGKMEAGAGTEGLQAAHDASRDADGTLVGNHRPKRFPPQETPAPGEGAAITREPGIRLRERG